MLERLIRRSAVVTILVAGLLACAAPLPAPADWENRLQGAAIVLLGEVHDNAAGQNMRLAVLQRALQRGWRPVIAMEQFDTDKQPLIDHARGQRPRDAGHLIEQAGAKGWDWALYQPVVQLALDHDLQLIAANLPRPVAARLVREESAAVLGAARADQLGLAKPLPAAWRAAQQREIDQGHCGALPATVLPGMVRAQSARDAVIADLLARNRANGAVLIAGNGHVRSDLGVPRWLATVHQVRTDAVFTVGYLESADAEAAQFDAVVTIPQIERDDPCLQFKRIKPEPAAAAG